MVVIKGKNESQLFQNAVMMDDEISVGINEENRMGLLDLQNCGLGFFHNVLS